MSGDPRTGPDAADLADRLARVRTTIARSAARAGRDAAGVRIVWSIPQFRTTIPAGSTEVL